MPQDDAVLRGDRARASVASERTVRARRRVYRGVGVYARRRADVDGRPARSTSRPDPGRARGPGQRRPALGVVGRAARAAPSRGRSSSWLVPRREALVDRASRRDGQSARCAIEPERRQRRAERALGVGAACRRRRRRCATRRSPRRGLRSRRSHRWRSTAGPSCGDFDLAARAASPTRGRRRAARRARRTRARAHRSRARPRAARLALADDVALARTASRRVSSSQPGARPRAAGLRDGDRMLQIDGAEVHGSAGRLGARGSARARRAAVRLSVERLERPAGRAACTGSRSPRSRDRSLDYGFGLRRARSTSTAPRAPSTRCASASRCSWKFLEDRG